MEQQHFLSLANQTSSISLMFPSDGTHPSSSEIQHHQQFIFYAQEVLSGYQMEKQYGTSVVGHKHHSITCHPKNTEIDTESDPLLVPMF